MDTKSPEPIMESPTERKGWTDEMLENPHHAPDKARRVRDMFNAIAPRYELVNVVFSFGRDRAWRRRAANLAQIGREDRVLDVASGTGDFARTFLSRQPQQVVASDFAHEMLARALRHPMGPHICCEADAMNLPFADNTFSVVSCAFGVRNFQDLSQGLGEMARVLRPGGRAVILEFTTPSNRVVRKLNHLYAHRFMPVAAGWLSGDRVGAYRYLPRSVESFLTSNELCAKLRDVGFSRVNATSMTMGMVTIYIAWRDHE
ncbi:MAG: ubiquinone/menaquinone biosynthesis methyltransferase [Planctomycetota bacterium]|jgi:demethylmenaquinone methyltransferase/2-methoxy-6-polyprenyl-1,4-benzoquinol methylase